MSEIPGARVVRGGDGGAGDGGAGPGGPRSAAAAAARPRRGLVLRLAPRALPRALVWRLWFGGVAATVGWIFTVVGLALSVAFMSMVDLSFGDYDQRVAGMVTRVEETTTTVNDHRIYRVHYTFRDAAGATHQGASYTTSPPERPGAWDVEYQGDDPATSRLVGMDRARMPRFILFVLIFPVVGLGLALWQLRAGRASLRLLRHGAETSGKLIHKRETNVEINDVPVMALTFEYEVDGRRHTATVKTLTPALLEDDEREPMLYDPHAPWRATTLDHLPGSPRLTADGELEAQAGFAGHLLILPILSAGLVMAAAILLLA